MLSALRPPVAVLRQASGWVYCWPLPVWVTISVAGSTAGRPRPWAVWARSRCFIDTVSPARSSVRSNTVWARSSACASLEVGRLKRQASMPRFQSLQAKVMSSTPWASRARALTK